MATKVTAMLRTTVFFRPIEFISSPVGTENTANQRNTIIGRRFARVSLRWKSCLT